MNGLQDIRTRLEMITAATDRAWRKKVHAINAGDIASAEYWNDRINLYRAERNGILKTLEALQIAI